MSCLCRSGRKTQTSLSSPATDGHPVYDELVIPQRLRETCRALWQSIPRHLRAKLQGLTWILVRDGGRFGSCYIPDKKLIVLDDKQIRGFTAALAQDPVARLVVADHVERHGPSNEPLGRLLYYSIAGRVLAHELGHAMRHQDAWAPYTDEEKNADYLAGQLDAKRHKSRLLGEQFFFSIGCNHSGCDHPTSEARMAAYAAGYQDEQDRQQTQAEEARRQALYEQQRRQAEEARRQALFEEQRQLYLLQHQFEMERQRIQGVLTAFLIARALS